MIKDIYHMFGCLESLMQATGIKAKSHDVHMKG